MLFALAWRNIWRNRRRTLLTVAALTLGVGAIVYLIALRESVFTQLVAQVTAGLVGNLQVHGKGYQADPEIGNVVPNPQLVEAKLAQALPGATGERRVVGYGLAGAGDNSSAALLLGVQPARDAALFKIEKGRNLDDTPHAVVLGRDLAQQLGAAPGRELTLVGQAADGSLANDRFNVVGVADAGSADLNASAVFLQLADAQTFFGLGDGVNQIIVHLPQPEEDVSAPAAELRSALDLKTLEVLSWSEILPELKALLEQKRRQEQVVDDVIIMLLVGLGVLNTMTMATFERTREFGVMTALGTRRRRILGLVVVEALMQGAIGCALGVGLALLALYGQGTFNMGGMGNSDIFGVAMPAAVRLLAQPAGVLHAVAVGLLTVLAGGLGPAIRASRLRPVEAIRRV